MIKLVKVRGRSMLPTLASGDYILTKKARSLRPGFIYVLNHPELGRIVKRLDSIENQSARFSGDGTESNSPNIIGNVPLDRIEGRAWLRISASGVSRL